VLVHGAFAESASWNGVVERLLAQSIEVVAVANPLRSLARDAAYVRDVIAGIGRPVVLVAHSYGGMVITEAAAQNSALKTVVYVIAFALDQGGERLRTVRQVPRQLAHRGTRRLPGQHLRQRSQDRAATRSTTGSLPTSRPPGRP
jgi:pimeloyl-ACP methyl ester carboxylesterase